MARLPIIMPKMSMTMTEGEVSSWMVKVGDVVTEGDVVCEVMTDKVDMEVESTVSGRLTEIVVDSGTAAVGDPIGWVEGEASALGDLFGEDPEPAVSSPGLVEPVPDAQAPAEPSAARQPSPDHEVHPSPSGPVAAIPRARGIARERGVDLATVVGTGPDGVVTVRDVEDRLAPPTLTQPPAPAVTGAPAAAAAGAVTGATGVDRSATVRRVVARKMSQSAAVPQFTLWRDIDLTQADAARGVSWTTVFLRAYAAALREVPVLLTRWEGDSPVESGPPSVALAVATDGGLLVPVFSEPDRTPAADLDAEIRSVVSHATSGRVDQAHLGVANGALSNLGGLGVDRFQALVTPPQASVLALGSVKHRAVAVPGGVGSVLTVTAGLTVDHRVADGADGARFLEAFVSRLRD